ncbi:MAG: hypothetical protein ACOH16_05610 [Propionibacteriaceae bacterium]
MIDSTPPTVLVDTAGSVSTSPYGGGGRRAVMPEPASNPTIGQSPASPYTAGFTEPLVRRATPVRTVPSPPAPVEPVSLASPVPPPSPASSEPEEDARLEEPSPSEPSPSEESPPEPSPTEPETIEPETIAPETIEPSGPLELAEPTADQEGNGQEATPGADDAEDDAVDDDAEDDAVDDDAIEADAVSEEPVVAVTEPSRVTSIPWIPRVPEPSLTEDMSAAQAYMTPLDPSMWFIGPLEETQAPPFVRVRRHGPERVDRGLLFASIPLILGWVLSAAMYRSGHIPSILALAMAPAGALLYGKGAGSRPHAGAGRLVALLVVGVLLAWPISLATELFFYYTETTGTSRGAVGYVVSSMLSASLFMAKLKEFLLVALFGLGGVIAVAQTIVSTRRRRRRRSDAS